jgi:tetratricopeptide (TPR) repeat protein
MDFISQKEFAQKHNITGIFTDIEAEYKSELTDELRENITSILNNDIKPEYYSNHILLLYIGIYNCVEAKKKKNANFSATEHNEACLVLSAEKGNYIAMDKLALIYRERGNIDLATEYYLRSIELGYVEAMFNFGNMCYVKNQNVLAEKYLLMASRKGHANANNHLGLLYDTRDEFIFAEHYYLLAVEQSDVIAMVNLGNLYKKQNDMDLAEKYYIMALNFGSLKCVKELQEIITPIKLYNILRKFEPQKKAIIELMNDLRKDKTVHNFANKLNLNSKDDMCPICNEETKLIPLECSHFYCADCFIKIDKCSICQNN